MKNKRDRLFFTQLFVPQASQSSYDRRAELDVRPAIPSAQSACGMEIFMEEKQIIAMLWKRDEYGLKLLQEQYSAKLMKNRENKITHEAKKDIHEKDQVYLTQAYNAACELSKEYNWYVIKCVKDGKIRTIQDINDEIFTEVKKHI